ncbi:MAG TPA: TMEM43 family protein [Xanthomonadaceae bacterium]|nr:TMEM43 family protein [Xanthomonadaceae bacterium]
MSRGPALLVAAVLGTATAAERPDPAQVQARAFDPDFGIAATALVLARTVEMYQWQEVERGALPEYVQEWVETPIDSSGFVLPQGHANPPMPFGSARFPAPEVTYRGEPVDLTAWEATSDRLPLDVDVAVLPPNLAASLQPGDGGLTSSQDPAVPRVGDIRLRWSIVPVSALPPLERKGPGWVPHGTQATVDAIPGLPGTDRVRPGLWAALVVLLLVIGVLLWHGRGSARTRRR